MLGQMLIRGGIIIAGMVATNAVLEKFERRVLEREAAKNKEVKSEAKVEAE